MNRLPYFKAYSRDWLGSQQRRLMTHEQRGVFWDLVHEQWESEDCRLAFTVSQIAKLIGATEEVVEAVLKLAFKTDKAGAFFFEPIESQYVISKKAYKQKVEAGKKSAAKRQENQIDINARSGTVGTDGERPMNDLASGSGCIVLGTSTKQVGTSKKDPKTLPTLAVPLEILPDWNEYREFRRDIKKPLTERSATMALKSLESKGAERAIRTLRWTVYKGWQGLVEPTEQEYNQTFNGEALGAPKVVLHQHAHVHRRELNTDRMKHEGTYQNGSTRNPNINDQSGAGIPRLQHLGRSDIELAKSPKSLVLFGGEDSD